MSRMFVQSLVEFIGNHLKQPSQVIEAALTVSCGDGIINTDPLVKSLKQETLVDKYGPEVVVYDFIDCVLLQGQYVLRCQAVRVLFHSVCHLCIANNPSTLKKSKFTAF